MSEERLQKECEESPFMVWSERDLKCVWAPHRFPEIKLHQGPCGGFLSIRIVRHSAVNPTTPVGPERQLSAADYAIVQPVMMAALRAAKRALAARSKTAGARRVAGARRKARKAARKKG